MESIFSDGVGWRLLILHELQVIKKRFHVRHSRVTGTTVISHVGRSERRQAQMMLEFYA